MHFTTLDGLKLEYTDLGSGTPLLCLAGLTRNLADFDDLLAKRGATARFICLTSRGRRGSDFDRDWRHYSIVQESIDALALIDHLNLPKVTIIGTSRGGLIALALAAFAKDRLAGVLFNDVGPVVEPDGITGILTHLGRNPKFANLAEAGVGMAEFMSATFPDVSSTRWQVAASRWWVETTKGLEINYDPHLRDAFEAARNLPPFDLWPLFDALTGIPLAVLRGDNSTILSRATVAEMQFRNPQLIVQQVANRGHVPFLDEPDSLAAFDALLARIA